MVRLNLVAQIGAVLLSLCVFAGTASGQGLDSPAEHVVIYDATNDRVLWSKNAEAEMIPASMTKIMTAYMIFERLESGELTLEQEFTTSLNAYQKGNAASGGSTMFLEHQQRARVIDLLQGLIVVSGNDAAIVLAEGVAGTEDAFADEMTLTAQALGLDTAKFDNATGLYTDTHRISAMDLARLTEMLIERFPEYYAFYRQGKFEWNGIEQGNRNLLLGRTEGADGVKTGHLDESGYGMVASAERDGTRIIVVVNGIRATNADGSLSDQESKVARANEAERLLNLGFTAFETRQVGELGQVLAEADVFLGNARTVGLTLKEPVSITALGRSFRFAKSEVVIHRHPVYAPVQEGDVLGELIVSWPDGYNIPDIHAPLHADRNVPKIGFLQRALAGFGAAVFGDGE